MQRFTSAVCIITALAALAVPVSSYASPLTKEPKGSRQPVSQWSRRLAEYGAYHEETASSDDSTNPVSLSAPEDPGKSELVPDIPVPMIDPDHPTKSHPFLTDEQAKKLASDTLSAIVHQLANTKPSPSPASAEFAADMWEVVYTREYPFSIYLMDITIMFTDTSQVVHKVYPSSAWETFKPKSSRIPTVASAFAAKGKVVVDVKVKYFTEDK